LLIFAELCWLSEGPAAAVATTSVQLYRINLAAGIFNPLSSNVIACVPLLMAKFGTWQRGQCT